jgi:hypothetical protein
MIARALEIAFLIIKTAFDFCEQLKKWFRFLYIYKSAQIL